MDDETVTPLQAVVAPTLLPRSKSINEYIVADAAEAMGVHLIVEH